MGKVKAQLRYVGLWPDGRPSTGPDLEAPALTLAARRLAESVLEGLGRAGVSAFLDRDGRVRFRTSRFTPPSARRTIEVSGDLIEAALRERVREANG